MDDHQVLINILNEMNVNLQVILRLANKPSSTESVEERFYRWLRNPVPLESIGPEPTHVSEAADTLHRFISVVTDKIAQREPLHYGESSLERLQAEIDKTETKLQQLESNAKEVEEATQIESQLRLDLIRDLQSRIQQTKRRTAISLRLAKECGETARKEWEEINRKPMEELQLHHKMLSDRLSTLVRDNATIEAQLTKCREERAAELEMLKSKTETDIRARQDELDRLRKEVAAESVELQELERELEAVTVEYDDILSKRKEEENEVIRQRLEERRRERAAIKIQRWFRFFLFRTMKARKKRKNKAKRKVSKELPFRKEQPSPESKSNASTTPTRSESQQADDESDEPPITAPSVQVSRKLSVPAPIKKQQSIKKSDENIVQDPLELERPLSADIVEDPTKKTTKKTGHAIRSITVKKSNDPETSSVQGDNTSKEPEIDKIPVQTNINRSSQTDNRVPKSKPVYR